MDARQKHSGMTKRICERINYCNNASPNAFMAMPQHAAYAKNFIFYT